MFNIYRNLSWITFLLCVSVAYQTFVELKQVPERTFPYLVAIKGHRWCHGILISKNYVLTNARCVVDLPDIAVHLGWYVNPENVPTDFISGTDSQIRASSNVIVHPSYKEVNNNWLYLNDIALVKLSKTVTVTSGVRPVKLANPKIFKNKDLTGQNGIVFGWFPPTFMSAATVQIRSHKKCKSLFKNYQKDRQFCIQWPVGERLCYHHSLPLEVNGTFIGLQQDDPSNNVMCRDYEYKFLNILYYYNWIMENSDLKENTTKYDDDKDKLPDSMTSAKKEKPDPYIEPKPKCKIDIASVCPKREEL